MLKGEKLLEVIVNTCEDRNGQNCVVLNMANITPVADYYVICHGNNERQVQAIAKAVKETAEEHQVENIKIEGLENGRWILIDLGAIVCHVFHKEERDYYHLERLWGDATKISIGEG